MDNSIPGDRLGRWIDFCNAEDTLGIKNMKRMKNSIRPLSMAFEHGSKVTAPHPYHKFDYVYTMVDAPPSWIASEKYSIVLRHWCNMCLYFSDETNRSEPTGQPAGDSLSTMAMKCGQHDGDLDIDAEIASSMRTG